MNITTTESHQRRTVARLSFRELQRVVAAAVAEKAGINLDDPRVVPSVWFEAGAKGTQAHVELAVSLDRDAATATA